MPAGPTWPNNLVASAAPHWPEMLLVITSAAAGGRKDPVVCEREGLWRIGREGGRVAQWGRSGGRVGHQGTGGSPSWQAGASSRAGSPRRGGSTLEDHRP